MRFHCFPVEFDAVTGSVGGDSEAVFYLQWVTNVFLEAEHVDLEERCVGDG